jgi:hypothetical protein
MRKILLILGCLLIGFSLSAEAQFLSPVAKLEGAITSDTKAVFIGQIRLSGSIQGFQIDTLGNSTLTGEINAYPLLGTQTIDDIENLIITDIDILQDQDLEDISKIENESVIRFSHVDLIAEDGFFLLGMLNGETTIQTTHPFALSTLIDFDILEDMTIPSLIMMSSSQMETQYAAEVSFIFPLVPNGTITVKDQQGEVQWDGTIQNMIFLIDDPNFRINQDSPLYIFPLSSQQGQDTIVLSVSLAKSEDIDIITLIDDISEASSAFNDLPDFSEYIGGFETLLSTATAIINGGMILIDIDETFTIDNTPQSFSGVGFARGDDFQVSYSANTSETSIEGEYRLVFLGDHLYTAQAKESDNGIAVPLLIIIIWVIALSLYFVFHFYIKKEVNEEFDKKIKKYSMIFHIVALVITFILLDREISYQFGISAIDALLGQGVTLIFAGFIFIEFVMWIFGFVALAFPLRIIANSVLHYRFGIGKGGKSLGKGIGAFGIWVFCALYVKVIINVIFLLINPNMIFPMG